MLIDCICGESKFAINAEQIGFDGRLVKCGKCGKEWFQESKQEVIEKKLINLDQSLRAKEIMLADDKNYHSDKISSLERALETKNKELENQKTLEQRLTLFESRIKDNESETSRQKKYDERIIALEKQLEKTTLDLFIKNTTLEKRSAALQEQLNDKSLSDRLSSLEQELVPKKVGGITINTKKPMKVFDGANSQQSSDMQENAQPFEIDEITKVTNEDDSQSTKEKTEEKTAATTNAPTSSASTSDNNDQGAPVFDPVSGRFVSEGDSDATPASSPATTSSAGSTTCTP